MIMINLNTEYWVALEVKDLDLKFYFFTILLWDLHGAFDIFTKFEPYVETSNNSQLPVLIVLQNLVNYIFIVVGGLSKTKRKYVEKY